jgi:hypothetical protein
MVRAKIQNTTLSKKTTEYLYGGIAQSVSSVKNSSEKCIHAQDARAMAARIDEGLKSTSLINLTGLGEYAKCELTGTKKDFEVAEEKYEENAKNDRVLRALKMAHNELIDLVNCGRLNKANKPKVWKIIEHVHADIAAVEASIARNINVLNGIADKYRASSDDGHCVPFGRFMQDRTETLFNVLNEEAGKATNRSSGAQPPPYQAATGTTVDLPPSYHSETVQRAKQKSVERNGI